MSFNKLIINSSGANTELCTLTAQNNSDKSPYSGTSHRHAYTAVYDFLFSKVRYDELNVAEIGIYDNAFIKAMRSYFPNAYLYGFELESEYISRALNGNLSKCKYYLMDEGNVDSIEQAFKMADVTYDIIIEDGSHIFQHQINVIHTAHRYLKSGGILVIEDIFVDVDENKYYNAIKEVSNNFSNITFVDTDHVNQTTDRNKNDRLLILFKK